MCAKRDWKDFSPFSNYTEYFWYGKMWGFLSMGELLLNRVLIAGIAGWGSAQVLKAIIHAIITRRLSIDRLFGDGGMPSGHSATVSAMAMMAFRMYGASSFEFAISCMLAIIVMHDAMGVRLETGKQAKVINEMMELFMKKEYVKAFSEDKLEEFVGHTPIQVIAGCLLGLLVGWILY